MKTQSLSLTHLIREPEIEIENPPVLFLFHGYGSNEEDLFSFAGELPEELFIISVQAPYDLMPYGYAWYAIHFDATDGKWSDEKQAIVSRDSIVSFIDEACEAYQLDKEKISLLGFSQGSILSYAVALSYPGKIRNVIALSGYMNLNLIKSENLKQGNFQNLHIYASHGSADQVIPVEWARKTPEILKDLNIDYIYEEFPVGHGVAPQNFYSFNKWLRNRLKED
ncbi:alpha/beta hydrolase [Robertkochia solimangrovi]|uniref:alpha/beta hydrolase n=1 Tax=Robertkochia solimangrovi TaxID=2213046 RepID=UPI00117F12A9|nr:dienelactone hydrolase family protein [Robertkochia solimangrovi]TRZ45338.1 phospholipase [Robertkochia solimangrovi]